MSGEQCRGAEPNPSRKRSVRSGSGSERQPASPWISCLAGGTSRGLAPALLSVLQLVELRSIKSEGSSASQYVQNAEGQRHLLPRQAPGATAVLIERLLDQAGTVAIEQQAQPQVPVLGISRAVAVSANRSEGVRTHGPRAKDEILTQDADLLMFDVEPARGIVRTRSAYPVATLYGVRGQHGQVGSSCGSRRERRDAAREPDVVGVEHGQQLAGRNGGSPVAGGGQATVRSADEADPISERMQCAVEVIEGSVVTDDYLVR
jgi:hypothetical protein